MPSRSKREAPAHRLRLPRYRRHKPSGQAVVTLAGRDHYLGAYGSKASKQQYDRRIAEWQAAGAPRKPQPEPNALTVHQLIAAWWKHLLVRYTGPSADKVRHHYRCTLRPLAKLYGPTRAAEFGPKALKTVRSAMLEAGLCRTEINRRVAILRRLFRWGVAEELLPANLAHALDAVEHLRRGEAGTREGRKVQPVAWADVEATLPHIARQVAAMVLLQWWSGCRPGEATALRPGDIDRSGKLWIYRPPHHKTEHLGRDREIAFGPHAQEVLRPFLDRCPPPDPERPLFRPDEAELERSVQRRAERKTALTPSQRARKRKPRPKRTPADRYDVHAYRRAIARGVQAENARRLRVAITAAVLTVTPEDARHAITTAVANLAIGRLIAETGKIMVKPPSGSRDADKGGENPWLAELFGRHLEPETARKAVERSVRSIETVTLMQPWHPHQLRHSAATRLRKEHGVEAARVVLGHASAAITEIYAAIDATKARAVMESAG